MKPLPPEPPTAFHVLLRVVEQPPGKFTASVVSLPEVQATADSRDEAIKRVRLTLSGWAQSGELVSVDVPASNPALRLFGSEDKDDPEYALFLEELQREREKLNQIPDYDAEDSPCPDTSSTPTT